MTNSELLNSVLDSLKLGLAKLAPAEVSREEMSDNLVFFGEVPYDLLLKRRVDLQMDGAVLSGGSTWFEVTDKPCGMEWKDESLDFDGLWIIEVEDLPAVKKELERIVSERGASRGTSP